MADILTNRTALTQPDSGDFLHIVDVSDLTDNAAGTSKKITTAQLIGVGTAFPTSNLWDGMPFHRTDIGTGLDCYYDATNTQWLSKQRFMVNFDKRDITANIHYRVRTINYGLPIYLDAAQDIVASTYVATTNDGSNYYTCALTAETATSTSSTTLHTFNTSADSADTWTTHDDVPDDNSPSSYDMMHVNISKTGSPGTLILTLSAEYQLIVT